MTWHPERLTPASRAEWLNLRQQDVTASQIACVVAAHPYLSAYNLWALKTGKLKHEEEETAAMLRGRRLEPIALDLLREHYAADGCPPERVELNSALVYWREPTRRIGATPDVLVAHPTRGPGVVQVKSVEPGIFARHWRDGDAIEPPVWIALQALTEAKLTGAAWAAVAPLRVGFGIDIDVIEVPLHEAACARLFAAVADFWRLVDTATPPPPDYGRDGKLLASLYPADDGATIDLTGDNELIDALVQREAVKRQLRHLEADVARCDAVIRGKAGPAQVVRAGPYRVTLKTEHVAEHVVKAFTRRPIRVKGTRHAPG